MATNNSIKSQSPYYDDFDPTKDFLQVLFRPGYPVQARELSTLQSFAQEQTKRLGESIYRPGTFIKGAEVNLKTDAHTLSTLGSGSAVYPPSGAAAGSIVGILTEFAGKVITNASGTVKARVLPTPLGYSDTSTVGTLFIQYITSEQFSDSEGYFYAKPSDNVGMTKTVYNTYEAAPGIASIASVNEGIYFVNDHFIRVAEQHLVVSTSSTSPSVNVGLSVIETKITQNEDSTLFDNARGTTNEGAPGAHRLKYSTVLTSKTIGAAADSTFYRIATFIDGVRQELNEVSTQLSVLEETLARRTNDESGSYALTPFNPVLGVGDSDRTFSITVSPSKAYVKGVEIEKTAPTRLLVERLGETKITKNNKTPIVGTTSLTVINVSATPLPGSTTGAPFTPSNRVELSNGLGVIGVARAWAIQNESKRGVASVKLYLYDIKMFTDIGVADAGFQAIGTGNDIKSNKASGYVYDEIAPLTGHFSVVSSSGRFSVGQSISSESFASSSTITSVTSYKLSEVTNIQASNGFECDVVANSFSNENSSLFIETSSYIKTLKDGTSSIMNNDFQVLENTGAPTSMNPGNGNYDKITVNEGVEIAKTLKFAYLKVSSTNAGYGWSSIHREISLYYPDVFRVYQINQTTANTFVSGRFPRINITTAGVLPQGSILTGETSGVKAVVALSNAANANESTLASGNFHRVQTGTGSADEAEVIFTTGTAFTAGENITVSVPGSETAYTFAVTYNSVAVATGSDITGNYLLDDGQRNEYYDIARLVRKENTPAPTNDIVVFFGYFDADPTSNHFYSADSYINEDFYRVDARFFGETREIKPITGEKGKQLRNGFDFRLRVKPVTNTTQSPFNFAYREFFEQDRILPSSTFTTHFEEYLGRVDLISLERTGVMKIVSGVPSRTPEKPAASFDGMPLFYATVEPVVRHPKYDVIVDLVDNRRYTMRDIGELDARIGRIEEQVSLNMLEIAAMNDDVGGRTKSGFVVSDFNTEKNPTGAADTSHPEYNATIDIINRQLIPAQTDGVPVEMTVSAKVGMSSFFPGFLIRNFTEEAFSTNMNATSGQKINPFATWTYQADVTLSPSVDHWRIREDDYFTSLYGELKPFEGNAAAFDAFNKITTASAGGKSTSVTQWIGNPKTTKTSSAPHTVPDPAWGGVKRRLTTTTTSQAQRTTTTTTFDKPRSTGLVTTTKTGTEVIQNPQDYFMRSLTVSYTAKNLKPNTVHNITFGDKSIGTATSDANGEISSSFAIPAQTFKAGSQTFSIKDTVLGNESYGHAQFTSIGHLDTYRNVAQTATEVVTKSTRDVVRDTKRSFSDPIAQMFMLPNTGSGDITKQTSILTSIDLWFEKVDTRPQMNKVKVEIRESANGYPGGPGKIIGESEYTTISASNEVTAVTTSNATNFKFREPIVLRGGIEYAIVVKCPSDSTTVYVATMGETLIDGSGVHSSQPNVGGYFGSFFVSQNASTWNAEQDKDLTYRLNRAKFDTTSSSVTLVNTNSNTGYHQGDIGAFNQGLAMETFENCNYVKVYHPNHGLHFDRAQVLISGVETATYNGIPSSEINGTKDVWHPTLNSYFIKVSSFANANGRINTGVFTTFATQEIVYDSLITNFMASKEEGDEVGLTIRSTTTSPLNLIVDNNKIANNSTITPFVTGTSAVEIDRLVEFEDPQIVRSKTNTTGNDLVLTLSLASGSEYTSPIITENSNLNPIVFRNVTGNLLVDSDIEALTTLASDSDNNIAQSFVSRVQAIQSELEHSAFVTKQVDLEIPADGFTVKFDADMAPTAYVIASFKARAIGDETPFEELEWIDFPYAQQVTELNYGPFSSDPEKRAFTLRADAPYDFSAFKIRLRMGTQNEAQIPKVSNLRIIADV